MTRWLPSVWQATSAIFGSDHDTPPEHPDQWKQETTMADDKQLKQDVLAELSWEPSVKAAHIGVTAYDGVVTLTGHVESFFQKQAAEKAAFRVRGVKAVAEEIEVKLPFELKRGDEEIAAAAIARLAWDASVPKDAIKVQVEKGWVSLTGETEWHFQKEAAVGDVRGLFGVVGVADHITIKAQLNATQIRDDITKALHRAWIFEPTNITVTAQNGNVHLGGNVRSWQDRQTAVATAWAAPGANTVENDITVI
jgi:osmotically-inducible protein OsmY